MITIVKICRMPRALSLWGSLWLLMSCTGFAQQATVTESPLSTKESSKDPPKSDATKSEEPKTDQKIQWKPLIKGSDLKGWTKTNFGGEGNVELVDGVLKLGFGDPLTGVTYEGNDFPKDHYEMRWEAQRVEGQDFFAGVTFPIGDEYCSLIAGGWGGGLTGISSIDGYDASENDTTGFEDFKNGQWYRFRVRIDSKRLQGWIDDREIVSIERVGHQFSIRIEVGSSRPLGYCNFQCSAAVRNWEYRRLDATKVEANPDVSKQTSKLDQSDVPIFLRIKKDENDEPIALQTTVSQYRIASGAFTNAEVDLIGAVHVGEHDYYAELNQRFKNYDALLFELVADPNVSLSRSKKDRGVYNPLSAMQVGMKDALNLKFQLDEVDYKAKNFVHADMTPKEFVTDMERRKDGLFSMAARLIGSSIAASGTPETAGADGRILAALMSKNRTVALRQVMAEQFDSMEIQMSGFADDQGKSTLVTERNRKTMEVLETQLKLGKRKLGIFYGAAHLKDMDRRLVNDFKAVPGEVIWLDAWKLK